LHALGDGADDHAAAVTRVGFADHKAGGLEAVDDTSDGARGEAERVGQLAGRGWTEVLEQGEALQVSGADAELRGQRLAEGDVLGAGAAEGADQRGEQARAVVDVDGRGHWLCARVS
jgi:hypothetical protein